MRGVATPEHPLFICYEEVDADFARRLAVDLTGAGIAVNPIGEMSDPDGLLRAGLVLVLLSHASKRSGAFHAEIAIAQQQGTPVLPVLVEGDAAEVAPYSLALNQLVDMRDYATGWSKLVMAVKQFGTW